MANTITLDELKQWVKIPEPKRHSYYDKTRTLHKKVKVHADGEKPGKLLTERRPAETEKIRQYREDIYVPVTKTTFTKVVNSLMKIRKSEDWDIQFDPEAQVTSIREDETLERYLMERFPKYTSITNWYFQVALKQQLVDTNAKVFVKPLQVGMPDTEFLQPYPFIFNSEFVLDYEYEKYYFLRSPENIIYFERGRPIEGKKFYYVSDTSIQIFEEVAKEEYVETVNWEHGLGYIPVYDFKGSVANENISQTCYESRIMGMIPYLDEYAREYSDMQAEVVQHVHSTMWAQQPEDCKACQGTGYVMKKDKQTASKNNQTAASSKETCGKCKGKGIYPFNPYENFVIGKGEPGGNPPPVPPAGFIQKDTGIVNIQKERIEWHRYSALAAINMEFLATTPLNQSGVAKEVDKDELNNFVHGVAEDGVELLDNIATCTNDYRNMRAVPNDDQRRDLLPTIHVPMKFDLLGDTFMLENIEKMKTSKVDPAIISAAEIDYADKRFATNAEVKDMVSLKLSLDPFAGVTDEEVLSRLNAGLISKEDAVVHANIHAFIEKAIAENEGFVEMDKADQVEILRKYAEEKIAENEKKALEQAKKFMQNQDDDQNKGNGNNSAGFSGAANDDNDDGAGGGGNSGV